jgi:hypothetical protein
MLLHAFVRQAPGLLQRLKAERTTDGFAEHLVSLSDMNALTGAADMVQLGARYDGKEQ